MDVKLKRVFTSLKRKTENVAGVGSSHSRNGRGETHVTNPAEDSPEGGLLKAINSFCTTGGPGNLSSDEEFLYLPTIVDIAESSPLAAALAATTIRNYVDVKNASRPYVQYNAIMLMRILAHNPGPTFTRQLNEPKFGTAIKELLRQGRDPSVWQILCETLNHFSEDPERLADENLNLLREVWVKERKGMEAARKKTSGSPPELLMLPPGNFPGINQEYSPPLPTRSTIPSAQELTERVSEATTSAKLLVQLLQSTPQSEIVSNELIKEFSERCKLAQRSMKSYISADNPAPDPDTLTTLIETNDVVGIALEQHRNLVAEALEATETASANENARVSNVGDLQTDAVMHGAVTHSEQTRSASVSRIGSPSSTTNTKTTATHEPITYRF